MKIYIYLFILGLIYNPIFSKTDNVLSNGQFKQYNYIDGLSSNFIYDVEKDKDGRIWAATQNGITIVDGQNFFQYGINDSLPSSDIIEVVAFNNNMYVATLTEGIYIYNGKFFEKIEIVQGKKINYMKTVDDFLFISTELGNILYDGNKADYMGWGFPKGKIVDVSSTNGNTFYAGEKNIVEKVKNKYKNYDLSFLEKNQKVQSILVNNDKIYIGTNRGLYLWSKDKDYRIIDSSINTVSLAYFKNDVIIVGTKKGAYSLQDGQIIPVRFSGSSSKKLSNSHIKSIEVISDHEIWYSTFGQGIIHHDPNTFYNISKIDGLDVGGMVYDIESYNGSLYVGTNKGMYIINSDKTFKHFKKEDGLPSNRIMDIEIRGDGVIYMATTKGLSIYDGKNFKTYSKKDGLPSNVLFSLHIDKNDNNKILLGSKNAGVSFFDGKKFITYSKKDGLPSNWVQDIAQMNDGTFIFACYGFGISFFDGKTFRNYNKGLSDNRVIALAIDLNEELWVGTESSGLGRFSNDQFTMIDRSKGLGHNESFSLLSDNRKLWVGTFGGGLSYFSEGQWFTMNTEDGLIGNTVGAISKFNSNSLAIGCDKGVTIFTPNNTPIQLGLEKVRTPKVDVYLNETINGNPEDRFSIYVKPIFYSTSASQFKYRTRIKGSDNIVADWSSLVSSPTIEYKDGYKEFMIVHESIKIGNYFLEIQAVNNKLNLSNIVKVPFSITKAWYLKPMIIIPVLFIFVGFVLFSSFTFINYRKQKIKTKELQDAEIERQNAELEEAREFQQSLLPNKMPVSDLYDIIGYQKTATEVGGDYFDFIEEGNGRIIAICGDATGHGLTSGNVVAITKTALSSIQLDNPVSILDTLNKTLLRMNIGLNRMCLNIADIRDNKIIFSSAGMPPAYFYSSEDGSFKEILVGALPLGSFSKSLHSSEEIIFKNKGDALILLSDGLPEAENPNGEMIGYEKTEKEIKSMINLNAEEIKDGLVKLCETWLNGNELEDDMTFVIIKKK